jgi:hypothetical protein
MDPSTQTILDPCGSVSTRGCPTELDSYKNNRTRTKIRNKRLILVESRNSETAGFGVPVALNLQTSDAKPNCDDTPSET